MRYDSDSSKERTESFACLNINEIEKTIERLEARVGLRFPDRGIHRIAKQLIQIQKEVVNNINSLRTPPWRLRIVPASTKLLALIAVLILVVEFWDGTFRRAGPGDLLQGFESLVNIVIFLYVGLQSAGALVTKWTRGRVLKSLNGLRSIMHVVDMHQLTKDPEMFISPEEMGKGKFPLVKMTRFEMVRYLDYCCEMYSLVSKLAALYLAESEDDLVHDAVNDIESIATGLSQKVWQKIMILDEAPKAMTE